MTTPAPAPADREALAVVLHDAVCSDRCEPQAMGAQYQQARAILARWRLVPVEQEPVRSWYRSLLTGGSVWCETSDPTDSYLLSDDEPVVMQRLDTYESSSGWQPWEPETPIQPLERD